MEMDEFLNKSEELEAEETEEVGESVELDVQKAVVESLAADKAIQDEQIASLRKENASLAEEKQALSAKIEDLEKKVGALEAEIGKMGETLALNSDTQRSNKVSLLDRETELPDRFESETYDQVLEVIREARDKSEAEGRERRAQILESVLVANEPSGKLAERRAFVEKLFADNNNILTGPVINELDKLGISYKDGENYLLASEIIKKTF